jgi:hypothetical protein
MSEDSVLGQLAEEFTQRVRERAQLEIEDYVSAHPELADRIRELFPTLMLLEGMAVGSGSGATEGTTSPLSVGSIFGNYKIEHEIGRGGMGEVFLGFGNYNWPHCGTLFWPHLNVLILNIISSLFALFACYLFAQAHCATGCERVQPV